MQVRIADSWQKRLQKEFDQPYFARLAAFVKNESGTSQRITDIPYF